MYKSDIRNIFCTALILLILFITFKLSLEFCVTPINKQNYIEICIKTYLYLFLLQVIAHYWLGKIFKNSKMVIFIHLLIILSIAITRMFSFLYATSITVHIPSSRFAFLSLEYFFTSLIFSIIYYICSKLLKKLNILH